LRAFHHLTGKINTNTARRLQRRQQVALSRADLEHPFTWRHKEAENARELPMVLTTKAVVRVHPQRDLVPVSDALVAISGFTAAGRQQGKIL
jgi:hypothetical protein